MDLAQKYAVYPYGNTNPTALDKRIVALLREVDEISAELNSAPLGNPQLRMHVNLPSAVSNVGIRLEWLLRDYRRYWERSPGSAAVHPCDTARTDFDGAAAPS